MAFEINGYVLSPTLGGASNDQDVKIAGERRPFESLAAFRAHYNEPTMPIDQCSICNKIPPRCDRVREDASCEDNSPPEVLLLEKFLDGSHDYSGHDEILRCPTCHRLYVHDVAWTGAEDYHSSWERFEIDELFKTEWGVKQRLPDHDVWWVYGRYFPRHAIVRFRRSVAALDDNNQLTTLDGATLAKLIDSDPPRLTDLRLARGYSALVNNIENPDDRRVDSFDEIKWREPLWDFEARTVAAARKASHVEETVAEQVGNEVRVRFWVISGRRLICRAITVHPDGRYRREDTVSAEHLPVALTCPPFFESPVAFRTYCGTPTMSLEQCPICSKLPDRSDGDAGGEPPEYERLVTLVDHVLRCPTCHRLYDYSTFSGGNDIYRGNETTYTLERCTADSLFDSMWGAQRRVPERRVDGLCPDRFFPGHVLVRFADKAWGALDARNLLHVLDGHDAIAKLIDRDPPQLFADLSIATRYAIWIDQVERPDDDRPAHFNTCVRLSLTPDEGQQVEEAKAATGLPRVGDDIDLRPTADRDGDCVVVKSWVMSKKRLICRVLTIQPSGHVIVEDAVIAENLPLY